MGEQNWHKNHKSYIQNNLFHLTIWLSSAVWFLGHTCIATFLLLKWDTITHYYTNGIIFTKSGFNAPLHCTLWLLYTQGAYRKFAETLMKDQDILYIPSTMSQCNCLKASPLVAVFLLFPSFLNCIWIMYRCNDAKSK